jgi:CHAT domain-containing protein/tetratricopeptide (TPR) repeat protein
MLTGEDAKKAAELLKRIGELADADKYAEAIRLQEELLALRMKLQRADHWETVNEKWSLTALKKVAALPEEKRSGWRKASQEANNARGLEQKGQYVKAQPFYQEHLNWHSQVLGEDHPHTATRYASVGINLISQGKHAEAQPLLQRCLEIYRKTLGEENPNTAASYNNLALSLKGLGKYAEAAPLYQKALDICREVLGEEHAYTANCYNNLAMNLAAEGKFAEAGPLLQKALDIRRKVLGEAHEDTANSFNNVAINLKDQGKYVEAGLLHQRALDICRKALGEEHRYTAICYCNLAVNLDAQGKYADAEPRLQKALYIFRKVLSDEHPDTATSYDSVASNLILQQKYAEAESPNQKALDIRRRVLGEESLAIAESYNNVAESLNGQGKYAEAGRLYQKTLDICRKVLGEEHPKTAMSYNNVARNLHAQRKYTTALAALETSARSYEAARLGIASAGMERSAFGAERSPYALLAATQSRAGRSADAWAAIESDLARGLLDEMASRRGSGLKPADQSRRDELESQRTPINHSIFALVSQPKRTDAEAAELDRLIEQRKVLEKSLIELAVASSRRAVATLDQLRAALPADTAFVTWVDVADWSGGVQEHWGCTVRANGDPNWERLPGSGKDMKWSKDDTILGTRFHEALLKSAPASEIEALAKKLHAQRLAPLEKHFVGVKRLFVAPVNMMAGIPIEALTDKYTVSYTPSGTYLARLKDRERPHTNGMLAVGDPVFPPAKEAPQPTALPPGGLLITQVVPNSNAGKARLQGGDVLVAYAGQDLTSTEQLGKLIKAQAGAKSVPVKVWREGQEKLTERELAPGPLGVLLAKEPAREAITAQRQTNQMLAKLTRDERFTELPGTQVEINRLGKLFDANNVTTLNRADASEQRLDDMRKADRLKQFRYLHFATHGKANNFRSFDSALILTPPEKVPEPRAGEPWLDGRLTAAEVLDYWKLDAELVTLSACESALGRQGGGDGLLGFAQAFLLAGSRSVCLTLWQVDDTATALLMDRFYHNLLGKRDDSAKPMGKAAALHEAKQWLRNLSAKGALERLGTLTNGVVRSDQPAREEMKAIPVPKDAGKDYKPYAHPRYWAAFILIGDPE